MPISATGNNRPESGFTLIELLVVIAIIGLATAAVVLAIPDPRGRLVDEADRFAARTQAARDFAIVEGRPVAVRVTAQGYAFDRRDRGQWLPVDAKGFRSQPWNDGTAALISSGGTERVAFDGTGQPDQPAVVTLQRGSRQMRIVVSANGEVRVRG